MQIKLDQNLPADLAEILPEFGHDVDTAPGEGLIGREDAAIWSAAQTDKRLLITQDLDFSDLRRFQPGTHGGIMLLRLRQPSRQALINRVRRVFHDEEVSGWAGCFAVVTESKVRVRKPLKEST